MKSLIIAFSLLVSSTLFAQSNIETAQENIVSAFETALIMKKYAAEDYSSYKFCYVAGILTGNASAIFNQLYMDETQSIDLRNQLTILRIKSMYLGNICLNQEKGTKRDVAEINSTMGDIVKLINKIDSNLKVQD